MASTENQGQGNDQGGDPDRDNDNDDNQGDDNNQGNDDDQGHDGDDQGDSNHHHDPPCYCRGTLIRAERGEVCVEDLAIGDRVLTISGESKPVKWIGKRGYSGQFIAGNRTVLPVVVRAGALAPDIPARDLWVSPWHALLLDGALVPAKLLVNGQTILQPEAVDQVEYFHLEFEAHEVIWAEGAPAESYVECDNRQGFHNAHEFAALYPDDRRASFGRCLPVLEPGTAELAAIRDRLFERAAALGHSATADPDLHLVVDGTIVAPRLIDGRYTFELDAPTHEVWLASRCGVPAELQLLSNDRRCLGVCIEQLVLRDAHLRVEISPAHPSLCEGFHEDERGVRRWTNGRGWIPERFLRAFTGGFTIEVRCLPPLPRYLLNRKSIDIPKHFSRLVA